MSDNGTDYVTELLRLHSGDGEALIAAARAEGDAASDKLVAALASRELTVRLIALKLLAAVGSESAVQPLLTFLANVPHPNWPGDPDWRERLALVLSPWLRSMRREMRQITAVMERRNVAYALSRLPPSPSAYEALRALTTDDDEHTRSFAQAALQRLSPEMQ